MLVLAAGDDSIEVTERVGRVLPDAFVRHLPGRPGYGAASNEVLGMVEGAAFFLLLHDDVALDPDAIHKMVEESFRSNAGVVSPKFVNWDDSSVLLHVGMSCDKTGAVVDRILEGEVDHGQHDAVRDVFVAPGGCILIRADLFRELKGFDPGIVAMGEDLDLSWRCQVAGAVGRGRTRRPRAPPRGGGQRTAPPLGGPQPARPTPRHAAVVAATPRAPRRPQVLHPDHRGAGVAAGRAACHRRVPRGPARSGQGTCEGRLRGLDLERPPSDRDLPTTWRAGRTPSVSRLRGAPPAAAG